MSGTSADGVSAVLADFQAKRFKILAYHTTPYPKSMRIVLARALDLTTPEISRLNNRLGEIFAQSALHLLKKARVSAQRVAVIGSHGQTVYHGHSDHPPNTLQLGNASIIAEKTGIPVVFDFRSRDMAAGGQGAPLIPYFDFFFYGDVPPRAFQNIGGISNVCVVGRNITPLAFDNGPGNSLMDLALQEISHGQKLYDKDGRLAAQGRVDMACVKRLLSHPYFRKPPPKSTGREMFGRDFLKKHQKILPENIKDKLATLTYFTASSIHESYVRFIFPKIWPKAIVVNGGGALNPVLMEHLKILFAPIPVRSIREYGIPVLAKEPLAFAFFGLRAWQGRPNHLPQTTGAKHPCRLGTLTFK